MYSIYKILNDVNDKVYIGLTKQSLSLRFSHHKSDAIKRPRCYFHNAIRKHGPDKFHIHLLDKCKTLEEAQELEKKYIKEFESFGKGYNSTEGGEGVLGVTWKHDTERVAKMSEMSKQRYEEELLDTRYGFIRSEYIRIHKGPKKRGAENKPITIDNVEYKSISHAAAVLNLSRYLIRRLARGETITQHIKPRNNYYKFKGKFEACEFFKCSELSIDSKIEKIKTLGLLYECLRFDTYEEFLLQRLDWYKQLEQKLAFYD